MMRNHLILTILRDRIVSFPFDLLEIKKLNLSLRGLYNYNFKSNLL